MVSDLSPVLSVFLHLLAHIFRRDVQYVAECHRIECLDFARSYKEVVSHFVSDEDVAVSVIDDASGRIDGGIYHRIILSIHLVFVVKYLDAEQSDDQYGRYDTQTDEQLVLSVKLHRILLFSVIRCESVHNYQ